LAKAKTTKAPALPTGYDAYDVLHSINSEVANLISDLVGPSEDRSKELRAFRAYLISETAKHFLENED
jgi:hypothetical protein